MWAQMVVSQAGIQRILHTCGRLTTNVVRLGRGSHPGSVPVKPSVPAALRTGPFTLEEASRVGITRGQLRGAAYRRLGSGLYRWAGLMESPQLRLNAIARRLPAGAAFPVTPQRGYTDWT
jgi:hypothetical protein